MPDLYEDLPDQQLPPPAAPPAAAGQDLFPSAEAPPAATATAAPVSAEPVIRTVAPEETVAGQLTDVISANSPVIQQQEQLAQRVAEQRGLQNSSLAVQAGREAAIGAALPIASADAATYARAAEVNQNAQNTFNLAEFQHQNALEMLSEDQANRLALAEQAFGHQTDLSRQAFEQAGQLSEQGFQQALDLSIQDFQEQTQLMTQELANQLQLSAQDQTELLQQLQVQHLNTLGALAEQARLNAIQSGLDAENAQELERLRGELDLVRIAAQSDATQAEIAAQLEGRIAEIAATADANAALNAESDARRMQMQYLQETGAIMRQAMQDIAAISTTEGLTRTQQQGAVRDVRTQMQNDLSLLQAYYSQSPSWDPSWGVDIGGTAGAAGSTTAPGAADLFPGGFDLSNLDFSNLRLTA